MSVCTCLAVPSRRFRIIPLLPPSSGSGPGNALRSRARRCSRIASARFAGSGVRRAISATHHIECTSYGLPNTPNRARMTITATSTKIQPWRQRASHRCTDRRDGIRGMRHFMARWSTTGAVDEAYTPSLPKTRNRATRRGCFGFAAGRPATPTATVLATRGWQPQHASADRLSPADRDIDAARPDDDKLIFASRQIADGVSVAPERPRDRNRADFAQGNHPAAPVARGDDD